MRGSIVEKSTCKRRTCVLLLEATASLLYFVEDTFIVHPLPGDDPIADEIGMQAAMGVETAPGKGAAIVGVPVGTDSFVQDHVIEMIEEGGTDALARLLTRMTDRRAAELIAGRAATL